MEGKMNFGRKVLLGTCGLAVVALPLAFAVAYTAQNRPASQSEATAAAGPGFEVASIKLYASDPAGWRLGHTIADPPNEGTFEATEVTVEGLVEMAFGVHDSWLIQGGPSWLRSEKFDIQAKAGNAANQELSGLSEDQGAALKHRMLQALLTDRFKLAVHRETKALPGYALVIAKNGPKLREADGIEGVEGQWSSNAQGLLSFRRTPMATLAEFLSDSLGCTVVDHTGLKGKYNFTFQWTSVQTEAETSAGQEGGRQAANNPHMLDASEPSIFTAIQEQLGLKLEPAKNPVEVLVIDHIEKPSLN
jgi:uncharacterized protein (TIGR03435 family)